MGNAESEVIGRGAAESQAQHRLAANRRGDGM
jgi:hypothetical protein